MTRAGSHPISDLRHKIDVARGVLRLATDQAFAKAVGISKGRLSDYLADRDQGPDHVSETSLRAMAALVAARLPGCLTVEQARLAWLADLSSFARALSPYPRNEFGNLVQRSPNDLPVRIRIMEDGFGLHDIDLNDLDPGTEIVPAKSRFDLEIGAPPGRAVVVLVESPQGWRLAAPRTPKPLIVEKRGKIFVPPKGLRFPVDGGLHVFFAFAIDGVRTPRIIERAGKPSPIQTDEVDAFALDLQDAAFTRGFQMGRLAIFVRHG